MKNVLHYLVIFLWSLLIHTSGYGQHLYKHFRALSVPEKRWTISHLFIAKKAYRITLEAVDATRVILKDSSLDNYSNGGQADAFRHTYWMARLTMVIGAKKAESLGKAHEKGNYKSFKNDVYEDGVLPDEQSSLMDLYNNEIGISIGKSTTDISIDELKNKIIKAIKNGDMKILKRDQQGHFLDCEGRIVHPALTEKTWVLPYCLVSSNQIP